MARAGRLEQITQRECELSREHLKDALAPVIGATLEWTDDKAWLINKATGSTYNTCLVSAPDPQLGMVRLVLDRRTGSPLYGRVGATWMVIHTPLANQVWLVPWAELVNWIKNVAANPQYQSAMMRVRVEGELVHVLMNMDWATGVKLSRSSAKLKGDYMKWRGRKLATKEDFVHLHNHSMYSLLDGASSIEGIADQALQNGQPGIAVTDHGYAFSAFKHWQACKERGIKSLHGVECYIVDDVNKNNVWPPEGQEGSRSRRFEHHQTILAMNETGWSNLCQLLTKACRDHYYYVPRIDHKMLFAHNEGLIVLSGCYKGMVAHYLQTRPLKEGETELPPWLRRDPARSKWYAEQYKAVFGDRYFIEVHNNDYMPYMQVVPEILQIASDVGVPTVLCADSHYEREEDAVLQAILSRISKQQVDGMGEVMKDKGVYYIRTRDEMMAGAPWATPDMCSRTCEIMQRCSLSFERKEYLFPKYNLSDDVDWQSYQQSKSASVMVPHQASDLYRSTNPSTSAMAAAHKMANIDVDDRFVVQCISAHPGCTQRELDAEFAPMEDRRIGKRCAELELAGYITKGRSRKCNITGRLAGTYFLAGQVPQGMERPLGEQDSE